MDRGYQRMQLSQYLSNVWQFLQAQPFYTAKVSFRLRNYRFIQQKSSQSFHVSTMISAWIVAIRRISFRIISVANLCERGRFALRKVPFCDAKSFAKLYQGFQNIRFGGTVTTSSVAIRKPSFRITSVASANFCKGNWFSVWKHLFDCKSIVSTAKVFENLNQRS